MAKVWVWFLGEYESREIEGVFASAELAQAAYDRHCAKRKARFREMHMEFRPPPPIDVEEHEVQR